MMKKIYPYLAAMLSMLFWASSFIAMKYIFAYMGPITLTFIRLVISAMLLPVVFYILPQRDRIKKEHIKHFMLMAFFEPFLYFIGESNGMLYVPASYGSVIIALIPLITPFVAWFLIKESLSKWIVWGAVVSFVGVAVIVLQREETEATIKGVSLLFLAVFSAVIYSIKLRQIAHEYKPITIVTMQTIFGMLYFLPVFLIFESKSFFSNIPPFQAFIPVIGLALFCTCGAFLLMIYSIKKIGLNNTNIFTNLIPVFTVILAYFSINEQISLQKVAGIFIVVSGLFISQVPAFSKRYKKIF